MLDLLKTGLKNLFYGEPITESYIGKVVRVNFPIRRPDGYEYHPALLVVVQDDGSGFIAGSLLSANWNNDRFLDAKDGLHHTRKRSVEVVANSVDEWEGATQIKATRKKWLESVCSNEAEVVGIVTDYDGSTYSGKTLDGNSWESKDPNRLAETLRSYVEQKEV